MMSNLPQLKKILVFSLLIIVLGFNSVEAQNVMQVNLTGGGLVGNGNTITTTTGISQSFKITNTSSSCSTLNILSINVTGNFSITYEKPLNFPEGIKSSGCNFGDKSLIFNVVANGTVCETTSTTITIKTNQGNQGDFTMTFVVVKSPIISVIGGNPPANINNGSTIPSPANGTTFGIVEVGANATRTYAIMNTGNCALTLGSITINEYTPSTGLTGGISVEFTKVYLLPGSSIAPGQGAELKVKFEPTSVEIKYAIISITNNAGAVYTFVISGDVFKFDIPGPGGVTADFRLWLKSTRGVKSLTSRVSEWKDLGGNGKSASQTDLDKQPTFLDNAASNINFNPVINFENNGSSLNQYLENSENGFYNQDIFIVMEPTTDVSTSSRMTIFSGTVSNYTTTSRGTIVGNAYHDNDGDTTMNNIDVTDSNLADDVTAIGLGNIHETNGLWYNQGSATSNPYYNITAPSTSRDYNKAGIINARNKTATPSDGMSLLYNSMDDGGITTKSPSPFVFTNLGPPDPDFVWGTPYKIGKNAHAAKGNLNGRVAEIMTFASRVNDDGRQKIETYLAIKFGITLGATTAEKNYIDSSDNIIWNIGDDNAGYNHNIAGIGKDDKSDLNQKQSKSVNSIYEVTIGLGGIFASNSLNTNEFKKNGDFLVWGCNDGAFTGASNNTVTIADGVTTSFTRIARKWKIVESKQVVDGDVENIYIRIPYAAFNNFSKTDDEEYVLIVAHNSNFINDDIIDVIPLKSDGAGNLQTWYDFDGIKYFTFGKAPKLAENNHSVKIEPTGVNGEFFLVGETALDLNYNAFTVSAWVKNGPPSTLPRTIIAKGLIMQMRLNSSNKVEVMFDDYPEPRIISNMTVNDGKWHQITFVFDNGTIYLYIDGILDKSIPNVYHPNPNFNHLSIGAVYIKKGSSNIINPFLGEIDEVYIWNCVLTQNQIRYLMNQESGKATGNLVSGKVLPQGLSSNEVSVIPWSQLKVYYDFNSFYGSTVEGLTDDRNFLRIKYLNKTKTITDTQTAPLPYVSQSNDGTWDTPATWLNNAVQNLPNSLGLDGVTKVDWNIVETSHNITSGDRDITVLALKNNSGKITIADPLTSLDENNAGQGLRVTHYLELDGVIDLVGESQLIQDEGSILDQDSGGYIERDQQGTANSFNYNYWSSSVGPISAAGSKTTRGTGVASTNAPFTIKGIINDGRAATPPSIVFLTSPYAADATPGAQLTISNYWLYQFYGADNDYNSWFPRINENSPLAPGVGYTMKGSSGKVSIANQQNYVFRGKPYNGDITLALYKSSGDVDRLIGNPYPSALDANEFIKDNIKTSETINYEVGRNSVNVFNGALYFWDHFGQIDTHILKEYVGGYATYTLMGGTKAIADDVRINTTSGLLSSKVPERYIPIGQGFFVITALDAKLLGKTTSTVEGGTITFKNSQRYFKREGSSPGIDNTGSVFMKNLNVKPAQSAGGKETDETNEEVDLRPRIRLLFHSPNGFNRQLLIGADENTTNNFDIGYDGLIADTGSDDMFWMIQDAKFVIQGVPNFNDNQEFLIGVKIAKAGLARIKIDALENMDENISLFIKDKLTGETHNISQKPFEINLDTGTYLDRFALIFKTHKLVAEDVVAEMSIPAVSPPIIEGIHVFMNNAMGELQIKNNSSDEILSVSLINTLGQTVKTWNSNFNIRTISLPISTATGVYLVQVNTKTGNTVKKISVK